MWLHGDLPEEVFAGSPFSGDAGVNWKEVARYWDNNADTWTELVQAGYDIYRDHLNTPAFLEILPDVRGLKGLDIGCGEGHNTRLVAERGAIMAAVDASQRFLHHAIDAEKKKPLKIRYKYASATDLPFSHDFFDFVMATMSIMEFAELGDALKEAYRVLKPGGFFQFSISHPCFQKLRMHWIDWTDKDGKTERRGVLAGDYFDAKQGEVIEWLFEATPPELLEKYEKFKVPVFPHTLTYWLNLLLDTGFILERFCEPCPTQEAMEKYPLLRDARIIGAFLHIRCRKPGP